MADRPCCIGAAEDGDKPERGDSGTCLCVHHHATTRLVFWLSCVVCCRTVVKSRTSITTMPRSRRRSNHAGRHQTVRAVTRLSGPSPDCPGRHQTVRAVTRLSGPFAGA